LDRFTLRPRGKLIIDDGASKALLEKGKSLLPSASLTWKEDLIWVSVAALAAKAQFWLRIG